MDRPEPIAGGIPAAEAVRRATAVQRLAADPESSLALSAAAGSGKTKVLVDRFIRLCLAGSRPKAILAVTFTNKAAMEIKDRLLQKTRRYALSSSGELEDSLRDLLGRRPERPELMRAPCLFEEILEDLSGLHVGTIHSFCQLILSRFAPEAGLDPRFRILEREDELWQEALDLLEQQVAGDPAERTAMAELASSPDAVRRALTRLRRDRIHLERWLDRKRIAAGEFGVENPASRILLAGNRLAFHQEIMVELRDVLFEQTVLQDVSEPCSSHLAEPLATVAEQCAARDLERLARQEPELTTGFRKQSEQMQRALRAVSESCRAIGSAKTAAVADTEAGGRARKKAVTAKVAEQIAAVRELLLTQQGKLRSFNGKKDTKAERQRLFAEIARPLLEIVALADLVDLYVYNKRLLRFGLRALDIYDDIKLRDRCVDFQDLERLAWCLMQSELALTVQYRFDEAIDHLLVDEFQDTNRNQWEILRPFAEEFLAGESARGVARSVFVVGDPKQSIYGFRGAEPAIFSEVSAWLTRQTGQVALGLPTNFRSLPAVVRSVGRLFSREPLSAILPEGEAEAAVQAWAREEAPGQVRILPVFEAENQELGADHLAAGAAVRIVRRLCAHGRVRHGGASRPVGLGDILVLCRSRSHINVYEQEFRAAGIPIIPAGRGLLAKSREVRDMLSLLRWLSYPHDSSALASVLRSPLFRWSEQKVQDLLAKLAGARLSPDRSRHIRSLWRQLERHAEQLDAAADVALLADWQKKAGLLACHELLRYVYRTGHALTRFAEALGEQAHYNLLRLFDLALSPELGPFPTLRQFAELIQQAADTAGEEEASLPERGSGRLRLMSVHSAKGLEAPIVLLVDADAPCREDADRLMLRPADPQGSVLYGAKKRHWIPGEMPEGVPAVRIGSLAAVGEHARREARREEADILYVAMTRARDSLYVLAARGARKGERESFMDWLRAAALADGAASAGDDTIPYSLNLPEWWQEQASVIATSAGDVSLPAGADTEPVSWNPPALKAAIEILNPSASDESPSLLGAVGPAPEDDDVWRSAAVERGQRIHLWLQMATEAGRMPAGEGEARNEARAVFGNPRFEWIFHPERHGGRGLCEVPVIHRRPSPPGEGRDRQVESRVMGKIDRLVLHADRIEIIDYKSDRFEPGTATLDRKVAQHRPQLEAYRQAVASLFPDRKVNVHLLFTHPDGTEGRGHIVSF